MHDSVIAVEVASLDPYKGLAAEISQRVALADAISAGNIFDFAPASSAAKEYQQLTEEITRCLKG